MYACVKEKVLNYHHMLSNSSGFSVQTKIMKNTTLIKTEPLTNNKLQQYTREC